MDPVVAEYLRDKADALRRHEDAARDDVPDSIHRARVTVRKIRSALRIFAEDSPEMRSVQQRLRAWGRTLGAARDAEVMRELLRERVARVADDAAGRNEAGDGAAVVDLAALLDEQLAELYERARLTVVGHLDSPEHAALRADLDRLTGDAAPRAGAAHGEGDAVPLPTSGDSRAKALVAAAKAARQKYRKRAHDAEKRSGTDADAAWHRARRAAKRARYAAELVADAVPGKPGRKAAKQAKRLKEAQSRLGEHQDEVTLRTWLDEHRARAAAHGDDTTPYDVLTGETSGEPDS
ncbi:CHAD domain-containing protein [Myceligenerans crystallogenes]|uniref:CHAD domain-containing protein n=1 Tax=Myceligenerans crystallogenes TaxID=316335 RepID=A0ABN2NGJ8_9MICO